MPDWIWTAAGWAAAALAVLLEVVGVVALACELWGKGEAGEDAGSAVVSPSPSPGEDAPHDQ